MFKKLYLFYVIIFISLIFLSATSIFAQQDQTPSVVPIGSYAFPFQYGGQEYMFYPSLKAEWNLDTAFDHMTLYSKKDGHFVESDSPTTILENKTKTEKYHRNTIDGKTFEWVEPTQGQIKVNRVSETRVENGMLIAKFPIKSYDEDFLNNPKSVYSKNKFIKTFITNPEPPAVQSAEATGGECPASQLANQNSQEIEQQSQNAKEVSAHIEEPKVPDFAYLGRAPLLSPEDADKTAPAYLQNFNLTLDEIESPLGGKRPRVHLDSKNGQESYDIPLQAQVDNINNHSFRAFENSFNYQGYTYTFSLNQLNPEALEVSRVRPVKGTDGQKRPSISFDDMDNNFYQVPSRFSPLWNQTIPVWEENHVPNRSQ